MNALRLVLIAMIVYLPNQAMFRVEFTVKGLNIINMMFLAALLLMRVQKIRSATPAPLKGPFYFFFFMLVWAWAVGVAHDPSEWVNDLTVLKNSMFYMLLYFLFYHAAHDLKTVRLLLGVILVVTALASVQGLRQALDYGIGVYNETRRVSAPFGWAVSNANRAAVFFVIFIPMLASAGLFMKSRPMLRLLALGFAGLGVFVVFFTYSRQAYFILAVLALLLTLRRSLLISLLIGLALLNYEAWAPETAITRIQMTSQSEESGNAPAKPQADGREQKYDESTESRFIIWEGAWQLIQERPWGIGLNHFKREIGAYVPAYQHMDAHNFYVLITTEAGLFGPLATLTLMFSLLLLGRRVEKTDRSEASRLLGIGYTMSVIALMLGNIYGSRFLDGDVMGNFWILTALVARYRSLRQEAAAAAAPAAAPAPRRPAMRPALAVRNG